MTVPRVPEVPREAEIRWEEARVFLRRVLAIRVRGVGGPELQDLTQEALVRLLRTVRRDEPRNLEALMEEIARRTAIDFLRRRRRWSLLLAPWHDAEHDVAASEPVEPADLGDPEERVRFVVLEFFRRRSPACREMAVAYFERRDWRQVAESSNRSHAAVRKQWSRCLGVLREAARRSPDPLLEWARRGSP